MKIAPKLILGTTLPAALVWVVGLYAAHMSQSSLQKVIEQTSATRAQALMDEIDRTIYAHILQWKAYGRSPLVLESLQEANRSFDNLGDVQHWIDEQDRAWRETPDTTTSQLMQDLMANKLALDLRARLDTLREEHGFPIFGEAFITNRYGANVAQTNRTTDYRQDDEAWWTAARDHGLQVDDVAFDDSSHVFSTNLSIRIDAEDGAFLGVLKIGLNIQQVLNIIDRRALSRGKSECGGLVLFDGKGRIIRKAGEERSFLRDGSEYFQGAGLPSEPVTTIVRPIDADDGHYHLAAYVRSQGVEDFAGLGWTLLVENDLAEVLEPATTLRRKILVAAAAATLIAFAVGGILSLSLSRRAKRLAAAAAAIGRGDFSTTVELPGKDELTQLGHAFNHMARELEETTTASARNNDWLMAEVAERIDAEKELEARAGRQAAVAEFGQSALASTELDELFDVAVTLVSSTLGVGFCKILQHDPAEHVLRLRTGAGWRSGLVGQATVPDDTDSQAGYTLGCDGPVTTVNVNADPRFKPPALLVEHGVVSGMSVAIPGSVRPFGVLGVHTGVVRTFTKDESHFLQAIANVLASAVERERAELSMRESKNRLQAILDTISAGVLVTDPETYRIVEANPTALRLIGTDRSRVIGRLRRDLLRAPDGTERDPTEGAGMTNDGSEYRLVRADGTSAPVLMSTSSVILGGREHLLESFLDITEHKLTEDALRRSEGSLKDAQRIAHLGNWKWDVQADVFHCSEEVCRILGLPPRDFELTFEGLLRHIHPDDRALVKSAFEQSLAGCKAYDIEHRITSPEGEKRYVHARAEVVRDQAGAPVRMFGTVHDITQRKQAEEELHEERSRLRSIVDAMDGMDAMLTIQDRDYNIIYQNGLMERTFGGLGQQCYKIYEGNDEVCNGCPVEKAFLDGRSHTSEREVTVLGDEPVYFDNSAHPVRNAAGEITSCVEVVRNVTARKRAEMERERAIERRSRLNELQQELLGLGSLTDKLAKITDAVVQIFEADFCRIWITKPGDLCEAGCIHAEITEGPHVCRYRDRCLHLAASSGRYTHLDGEVHRRVPFGCYKIGRVAADEEPKFLTNDAQNDPRVHNHDWARELGLVSFAGYQLRPPDGETTGVLALFSQHVVTPEDNALLESIAYTTTQVIERAEAEEHQKALQVQLVQAQKLESIGQLAAGIAHEINTPTQYVGDNTRFLQDSVADLIEIIDLYDGLLDPAQEHRPCAERSAEAKAALERLDMEFLREEIPKAISQSLEGVERVATIVRSMKEFSHPGAVERQLADLNRAIESTITVARNEWKYVAEMVTDLDASLPLVPCLLGDVNQVVLNMIVNAAHAIKGVVGDTGEKGTITVTTRCAGSWVEVRISDTGSGIPPEIRPRIFDPFFTTKEVGKGTGQGLAIAHTVIVQKHGGEIKVESEVGQGTTFIIRLPLDTEDDEQAESTGASSHGDA